MTTPTISRMSGAPKIDYDYPSQTMQAILGLPAAAQDKETAKWIVHVADDMRCRPLPSMPVAIKDYYKKGPDARKVMQAEPEKYSAFWNAPSVKNYFDAVDSITAINRRNKTVLLWARRLLSDTKSIARIDQYLSGYGQVQAFTKTEWPLFGLANEDKVDVPAQVIREEDIVWPEEEQ